MGDGPALSVATIRFLVSPRCEARGPRTNARGRTPRMVRSTIGQLKMPAKVVVVVIIYIFYYYYDSGHKPLTVGTDNGK